MWVTLPRGVPEPSMEDSVLALRGQEDRVPGLQVVEGGWAPPSSSFPGSAAQLTGSVSRSRPGPRLGSPEPEAVQEPCRWWFWPRAAWQMKSSSGPPSRHLSRSAYPGLCLVPRTAALGPYGWRGATKRHLWCARDF